MIRPWQINVRREFFDFDRSTWCTFDVGYWLHLRVQREAEYAGTTFVIGIGRRLIQLFVR